MIPKTAEWYDKVFTERDEYNKAYDQSRYLPLWTAIIRMLFPGERVLDIGCGPGQFAQMCMEFGHSYIGVDFSQVAIDIARDHEPEGVMFIKQDVSLLEPLPIVDYDKIDVVTFVEVLEHLDNDVEVLGYYTKDKPVILTVPDFMSEGHVRCFQDETEIQQRYDEFRFAEIQKVGRIFVCLCQHHGLRLQ